MTRLRTATQNSDNVRPQGVCQREELDFPRHLLVFMHVLTFTYILKFSFYLIPAGFLSLSPPQLIGFGNNTPFSWQGPFLSAVQPLENTSR